MEGERLGEGMKGRVMRDAKGGTVWAARKKEKQIGLTEFECMKFQIAHGRERWMERLLLLLCFCCY